MLSPKAVTRSCTLCSSLLPAVLLGLALRAEDSAVRGTIVRVGLPGTIPASALTYLYNPALVRTCRHRCLLHLGLRLRFGTGLGLRFGG